jgi:tellurite methyltransferase
MRSALSAELRSEFGEIDIYLFDQILKGRFDSCTRILDAGCGSGRNLVYFLQRGFDVHAVDQREDAVAAVRQLAARLAPALPAERFQIAEVDALPFESASMDAVLSSAVLHFARDQAHFGRMVKEQWRVLKSGGLFFARLASSIGIEGRIAPLRDGRFRLPDGTERFLVDEELLLSFTEQLGGELLDPIKTTNVQNRRAMTTWCLHKPI